MDQRTLQRLQESLKALPASRSERLILQSKPTTTARAEPPTPDQFPSRVEFRRALIEYEGSADRSNLEALVQRLTAMGLEVNASRNSETIVVQGQPLDLARALEDSGIAHADFDQEIELIRPVKIKKE